VGFTCSSVSRVNVHPEHPPDFAPTLRYGFGSIPSTDLLNSSAAS
ncbi:uncharacterized protein METZ01_LOCUS315318, partial [marine metagenome]